jgi:hypothetical protein
MIDILNNVPDKRVDKNTTSLKLKQDIIEYFEPLKLERCIEIGTSLGYSTYILSHIFNNVDTVDINIDNIRAAMKFNSQRSNIEYLHGDSTQTEWDDDNKYDMAFIDADHSYNAVINDINKCIQCGKDNMYIVFDDYGLPETSPCVKVAVDEMIANGTLKLIKYIGEPAGSEPRIGRPLIDWEGVITQVI